ncbi:hypothetical protein F4782DRAFT_521003 [Xylaria castorea]|nr:hypothetical protein F4782DRAFT_521003 [Xylaria castorea]
MSDTAKTQTNLLSFLNLSSELRNEIYELILLHQEPINPWPSGCFRQTQQLTPGLLRANKAVHREASSLFYGKNCFDLSDPTPEQVVYFLEHIGSSDAAHIRHVIIDFPVFLCLDPGHVTLVEGSASILTTIQSRCTNLSSLKTPPYSTNTIEARLDHLDNHKVTTEAFQLVDAHFRAISSLQEIILEVDEDGPSDNIRETMKSHGWILNTIEFEEEEEDWDQGLSDIDAYDYDHDHGEYSDLDDNDDYDIDNDSDFWRRAAD